MRLEILSPASAAAPHFSSKYLALLIPALLTTHSSPARAFSTTPSAHRPAAFPTGAARRGISMSGRTPPSPVTAIKPVRVLALHGYGQTGEIFSQKMGSVRKECRGAVEWVFLDAPFTVAHHAFDMTGPSWYDFSQKHPETNEMIWGSFDRTLELFETAWKEQGPFDGVVGFSQGAAVAYVLTALQERGELPAGISPFGFTCLISGFLPQDPAWRLLCEEQTIAKVRSLHIIGLSDNVVTPDRSEKAAAGFGGGGTVTVLTHGKGHLIPSYKEVRSRIRSFILGEDEVDNGAGSVERISVKPGTQTLTQGREGEQQA